MDEKMNGGISTLRGIFCRLSFQKGVITAETIAAQGFDGGIFSVDTRQKRSHNVGCDFFFWIPFRKLKCSGEMNSPSAKVLLRKTLVRRKCAEVLMAPCAERILI